jgi:negative regulator of flagellin synthesis FlgM
MPISPLNGPDQLRAARAVAAMRATAASAPSSAGVRQADTVSLSEAARSLASARSAVAAAPDTRADRVAELKAAIANGTYTVDSQQLARSLLRKLAG